MSAYVGPGCSASLSIARDQTRRRVRRLFSYTFARLKLPSLAGQ